MVSGYPNIRVIIYIIIIIVTNTFLLKNKLIDEIEKNNF